jgi:hypothetical protein
MTESEWEICTGPQGMLDFLGDSGRLTERKSRLFAVAAGRHRYWTQIEEFPECRKVFEVAEQDADGLASREELNAAYFGAQGWADHFNDATFGIWGPYGEIMSVAGLVFWPAPSGAREMCVRKNDPEAPHQANLLRCIFCNPFRPPPPIPAAWLTWNDSTIPRLAEVAYEERQLPSGHLDFARLAILADALEEAGCQVAEVLDHLRGTGPHVRGCWPVDLILGKS